MIKRHDTVVGTKDLHVRYRPYSVDEMLGNETNKRIVKKGLDDGTLPHSMLFTGRAGCGKTTMARIIATGLNCEHGPTSEPCLKCSQCTSIMNYSSLDVMEINVGKTGGKDDVAKIVSDLPSAPFSARFKVLIFDEAHKLTDAAKDLLLKPIEDGYAHVYYIFCTNHPEKLQTKRKKDGEAFIDRCYLMKFDPISSDDLVQLLSEVSTYEIGTIENEEVITSIAEEAKGVPRRALKWLQQVINEGSWSVSELKRIIGVIDEEDDPQIIEMCRHLNNGKFREALPIYEKLAKKMDAEAIKNPIMFYFLACLRNARTVKDGDKFNEILDVLIPFIPESGKLANLMMIHRLYKITAIVRKYRN